MTPSCAQSTPWHRTAEGLSLRLRAQPGARRNQIGGLVETAEGPALRAMVTEAAEKGRANKAIVALLAKVLGVPKSALTIRRGEGARLKVLHIRADAAVCAELEKRLAQFMQTSA